MEGGGACAQPLATRLPFTTSRKYNRIWSNPGLRVITPILIKLLLPIGISWGALDFGRGGGLY